VKGAVNAPPFFFLCFVGRIILQASEILLHTIGILGKKLNRRIVFMGARTEQ